MALTAREVWNGMLTELSKTSAPSLLLHEFNYYFNKAIRQYTNKQYNIYDVNQQTTDNLRVLKATAVLTPTLARYDQTLAAGSAKLFGATYEVILPDDYLHMLNCICIYKMQKSYLCYDKGDTVDFAAKRLTADSWSVIINDYYNRPLPERPYYYIHNVNVGGKVSLPTNPYDEGRPGSTDLAQKYEVRPHYIYVTKYETSADQGETWTTVTKQYSDKFTLDDFYKLTDQYKRIVETKVEKEQDYKAAVKSNLPRVITLSEPGGDRQVNVVDQETGNRHANSSQVRCEIRYGRDNSVFRLDKVYVDYIKAPQTIRLTKEQVDMTEDTSQIMEFPDYVCQEIINELTTLIMARDADPRLQVQSQVTQSIANPAQQQTPQPQPQQRGS